MAAPDTTAPGTPAITARHGMRRRLGRPLALGLIVLGLTSTLGATSANAAGSPGAATTSLSCGSTGMYDDTVISPQAGYSSQPVALRLYVKDLTSGAAVWTAWQSGSVPTANRFLTWHYPTTNHTYQVYSQYGWYSGGTWTTAGRWSTSYVHRLLNGRYVYTSYCYEY